MIKVVITFIAQFVSKIFNVTIASRVEITRDKLQHVLQLQIVYVNCVVVGNIKLMLQRVHNAEKIAVIPKEKLKGVVPLVIAYVQHVLVGHTKAMVLLVQIVIQNVRHRKKKPNNVLRVRIVYVKSVIQDIIKVLQANVQHVMCVLLAIARL